jgi:hypothetical protein
MNSSLEAAMRYAVLGYKVYPVWGIKDGKCLCGGIDGCKPGKHPYGKAVPHGGKQATTDAEIIKTWFPTSYVNVGIRTDGFCVLDVENKNGGMELLKSWKQQYGPMPKTPTARSGGGGRHFYFKPSAVIVPANPKPQIKFADGIELLVGGGVIVPPSNHISGGQYQWIVEPETPLSDMPEWLVCMATDFLKPKPKATELFNPMKSTISKGETFSDIGRLDGGRRNERVNSVIGSMVENGYSNEQILEDGIRWAEQQDPTYSVKELDEKILFFARKRKVVIEEEEYKNLEDGCSVSAFGSSVFGEPTPDAARRAFTSAFGSSGVKSDNTPTPVEPSDGLPDAALYGLVGDFVRAVEPLTEADPAGVLACVLTGVGNMFGRNLHHRIGRRHSTNLFTLLIGDTSSRKGTCWDVAETWLSATAPEWAADCMESGFGSRQGFVYRIRDAQRPDDGVPDKRLLVIEEEWAKPLRLCRSENSILSPLIRSAFDGKPLAVLNKGENRYGCREPHVSIIGMVTADELRELTKGRTEIVNGTINRFLLVNCLRRRYLPTGGDYEAVGRRFAPKLTAAVSAASRQTTAVKLDAETAELWNEEYRRLEQPRDGDYGKSVARLSVHCLKVAMLYAALDGSPVIKMPHLNAALSLVDYCDKSAAAVFGKPKAGGDEPFADEPKHAKLLNFIRSRNGINKTDAHRLFNNEMKADELNGLFGLMKDFIVEKGGRWFPKECNTGGGVASDYKNPKTEEPKTEEPNDRRSDGGSPKTEAADSSSAFGHSVFGSSVVPESREKTEEPEPFQHSAFGSSGVRSPSEAVNHPPPVIPTTPKPETQKQWAERLRAQIRAERGLL